jgi:hypothetical protein
VSDRDYKTVKDRADKLAKYDPRNSVLMNYQYDAKEKLGTLHEDIGFLRRYLT